MMKIRINGIGAKFGTSIFERVRTRLGRLRTLNRTDNPTTQGSAPAANAAVPSHEEFENRIEDKRTTFQN